MAKPRNRFEIEAREAAERIEAARALGQQLTFLPDEAGAPPVDTTLRKAGRPKGATGKGSSQMRDWLAAKGYRLPEDVLAEMAGLASREDVLLATMLDVERVLVWAFANNPAGKDPSPEQRLGMFAQLLTVRLRAADALMPYGAPKATPDVAVTQAVQIVLPTAPAQAGDRADQARDVTPAMPRLSGRMVPADVAHEIQQKQQVSKSRGAVSDADFRTDEASD